MACPQPSGPVPTKETIIDQYQMPYGLSIEPIDFDTMFRGLSKEPKIINDVVEASERDKDNLNKLIYTQYSGDLLSNLPSCEFGCTTGGSKTGTTCPECGTVVALQVERTIEPLVWIRAPQGVAGLINPIIWMQLKERFSKGGTKANFEVIRWLCDTDYAPRVQKPPVMKEVEALNIPRGLNNFINNFDEIMAKLFSIRAFRVKGPFGDPLEEVIKRYRHCIFSQYLPVPNRTLLIVEDSNLGRFAEPVIPIAVDAIRIMAGIDASVKPMSIRTKENRTVKYFALYAEFLERYYKDVVAQKEGVVRKHLLGTRGHWTGRAVIASITRAHEHDELHLPWGVAVAMARVHLISKLKRRNYGPLQAARLLDEFANRYSPLVDELLKEYIAESPYKGQACTIVRHPSLGRGSILRLFWTYTNPDPGVLTIGIPINDTPSMNADFDGDNVSIVLLNDVEMAEACAPLAPHMNTYSMAAPRKISGNPTISKPAVATIANALHAHHPVDPVKVERMRAAFNL